MTELIGEGALNELLYDGLVLLREAVLGMMKIVQKKVLKIE